MSIQSITTHPGLNPAYLPGMERRASLQNYNRAAKIRFMPELRVPKQPNRYVPHMGAKEAARHVGKTSLGPNASRVLA